jgi:hypothetical protein
MIELQYGNLKANLPGSWAELNKKQLEKIIAILTKETDPVTGGLAVIYYLLPKKFKALMDSFTGLELTELLTKFNFLTETPSFGKFLFSGLKTSWISPIKYHGPTDSFGNLTVREYGRAEFYLAKYAECLSYDAARAEENLNKFLGCLYFRKQKGERLVPLSTVKFDERIKRNALLLSGIPMYKKQAIAFNFSAVRDFVFSQFEDAFSKGEVRSKRDKYGWDGVILYQANAKNMVPDQLYTMNLLEFLIQLDTMAIAENERETQ